MITLEILAAYIPFDLEVSVRTRNDKEERIGRVCEITNKSNHSNWIKVWFDDVYTFYNTNTWEESNSNAYHFFLKQDIIKPIFRPLSELTEAITHNGERFVPINKLKGLYGWNYLWDDYHEGKQPFNVNALKWASLKKLLEWHFNVFNLPDGEYVRK